MLLHSARPRGYGKGIIRNLRKLSSGQIVEHKKLDSKIMFNNYATTDVINSLTNKNKEKKSIHMKMRKCFLNE